MERQFVFRKVFTAAVAFAVVLIQIDKTLNQEIIRKMVISFKAHHKHYQQQVILNFFCFRVILKGL